MRLITRIRGFLVGTVTVEYDYARTDTATAPGPDDPAWDERRWGKLEFAPEPNLGTCGQKLWRVTGIESDTRPGYHWKRERYVRRRWGRVRESPPSAPFLYAHYPDEPQE